MKKMEEKKLNSSKPQNRLMKESLKKLLGLGLLEVPQRAQHEIHPYVLKIILNTHILNNRI